MRTTRLHPLAEDYLGRLESVSDALPRQDREELLTQLRSHLEAGLPQDASDADVRNFLATLGTPEDIVGAAGEDPATRAAPIEDASGMPSSPWGVVEVLAVLALTVGAFVLPVVGPIVGVCLAWGSTRWTRREKVVATVLGSLPLIALAVGAVAFMSTSPDPSELPGPVPGIISISGGWSSWA